MPANLPAEWYATERKYLEAKTIEEKIMWLEKLISLTPKHKGTENLLAELRRRLAKLKKYAEKQKKKTSKPLFEFKKEGDILISFLGVANSGKSYIINKIANSSLESTEKPFETQIPKNFVVIKEGVAFQLVEIPSTFQNEFLFIPRISEFNIFVYDLSQSIEIQEEVMKNLREKGINFLVLKNFKSEIFELEGQKIKLDELLKIIWNKSNKIRVFTKPPNKQVEEKAIVLEKGSRVLDAIEEINEKLVDKVKYVKIIRRNEIKKVGLNFELEDGDIIEIKFSI
ncbi:MAG: TGS domain-containing protein [Candidatus Aenigmatarchaeota archaeon]